MLKSVFIDNYKCYTNFKWDNLSDTVFLGGINGVGKSTIFEVMALLRDVCGRGMPLVEDDGSFKVMGRTTTRWMNVPEQRFELVVDGNEGTYKFTLIVDDHNGVGKKPRIKSEELRFNGMLIFSFVEGEVSLYNDDFKKKVSFHADWSRSFLASTDDRTENIKVMWFRRWLKNIMVFRPNPWAMSSVANKETEYPADDLSDFSCWFRYLKQSCDDDVYAEYIEELKAVFDGFRGIRMESIGENAKEIKVSVDNGIKTEYSLNEISEGQRLLIALYAVLYFANHESSLICLDEPDNFFALREISPLIGKIMDGAENNQQFMITSHHPEFFNQLAMSSGSLLHRMSGRQVAFSTFKEILSKIQDMKLSVSEILSRGWEVE